MSKHPTRLYGIEHADIAEDISNLDYRELANFLYEIGNKIGRDSIQDFNSNRVQLANKLLELSASIIGAGSICADIGKLVTPFMDKK